MNIRESITIRSPSDKDELCAKFTIDDTATPFVFHGTTRADTEYTLSFYICSDAAGTLSAGGIDISTNTEWTRHIITFTADSADMAWLFTAAGTYYIYHPQLEIGNKATDWTAAPEDVEAAMIVSTQEQFYLSSSATALDGGEWLLAAPEWQQGKYIWRRTLVINGDGASHYEPDENGVCITGNDGKDGIDGTDGRVFTLESSVPVIKIEKGGVMNPSYLEFATYYRDGASTARNTYAGRFLIEETEDGKNWSEVYQSSVDEEKAVYSLHSFLTDASGNVITTSDGYGIAVRRNISEIRCTVYAAGGFASLLDRQTISVVKSADALSQDDIFNLLTNNGLVQGLFKEGNQIYINASYIRSGTFVAGGANNQNGRYEVRDAENKVIGTWDKDGLAASKGSFSGTVSGGRVEGSVISGSSFETQNSDSTERILIEKATQKFYSDAEWDTYAGEIRPNKLHVLIDVDDETLADCEVAGIDLSANYWLRFLVQNSAVANIHKGKATFYGELNAENFTASGTKQRIVDTPDYGTRSLYCYETPSPMFGDIGSAVINEEGFCCVSIDDIFSETVNCNIEYQVFLQKEGEGDLWVAEKEFTHFAVKGTPNLPFSWEVKALQRDYEYLRLDEQELRPGDFRSDSEELERMMDEELAAYDEELEELN